MLIIKEFFQDYLWFLNFDKRRFDRYSRIKKTAIRAILVYLHNTMRTRSRGPLSDAPVRFNIQETVFPQKRVKVSKLSTQNFQRIRMSRDLMFSSFWLIFDVDSDGLVEIGIFKLFRIPWNKV